MATTGPADNAKPVRNEPALKDINNVFPKPDRFEPRELGKAGVRYALERALQGLHSFGDELWESLGIQKRELATRKAEIVEALKKVVADPERSYVTNRTAAVAILGEIGGPAAMADLVPVLTSPFERPTTRAWAAVAVGKTGRVKAVQVLTTALEDPDPLVRRKVVDGLAATRSKEAVEVLRQAVKVQKDAVIANRAFDRVRELEKALKLRPAALRRRPTPKGGGTTAPAQ